jgi:hypothetical protein
MTEGQMVKSRLDGPPELTEIERTIAHGKLLLKALYADHPGQRLAARRAIALLLGIADGACDDA